jgi:HAMP domain-containing protein/protein-tyrosine-phosphatase
MRALSIQFKVVLAILVATSLGTFGIWWVSRKSYERNVQAMSEAAVAMSRRSFQQLTESEVAKMQSVLTLIVANRELVDRMSMARREELLAATLPLYDELKRSQGITNFNYIDINENRILVMSDPRDPKLIGTKAIRHNIQESARTKSWGTGLALGFNGFALRITHPVYDSGRLEGGQLVGYVELGTEINSFTRKLKAVTGHEYALLLKKKYLQEDKWASGRKNVGLENNWSKQPDVVVATNTTANEEIFKITDDLAQLPDAGRTLGISTNGPRQLLRGVFPIRDAAQQKVGAIFVVSDVTALTEELRRTLIQTMAAGCVLVVTLAVALVLLLRRLVFRRLDEISRVATRVVGGDFETPIRVGLPDEIGKFEELLEQFRGVVVSLVADMLRLQGSAASAPPRRD